MANAIDIIRSDETLLKKALEMLTSKINDTINGNLMYHTRVNVNGNIEPDDQEEAADDVIKSIYKLLVADEMCMQSIDRDPMNIINIPLCILTPEMAKLAVTKCPKTIAYIPKEMIDIILTPEIISIVMENLQETVRYIPAHLIKTHTTPEKVMKLLKNNPHIIAHLPSDMLTHHYICAAIDTNPRCMNYLREEHLTDEVYKHANNMIALLASY
jgi:hypothetical protein